LSWQKKGTKRKFQILGHKLQLSIAFLYENLIKELELSIAHFRLQIVCYQYRKVNISVPESYQIPTVFTISVL
jgi:hypothetical protein